MARLEVASTHLVLLRVNINIFGDFDDTKSAFSQRVADLDLETMIV